MYSKEYETRITVCSLLEIFCLEYNIIFKHIKEKKNVPRLQLVHYCALTPLGPSLHLYLINHDTCAYGYMYGSVVEPHCAS